STNHRKTSRPKKPPFTYTELIEYALEDKGELTVSGIYQWISDRFPYYKSNDDRWKNSVRHNLSINPHFRKGVKAPQGAGHLWAISSGDSAENVLAWEHAAAAAAALTQEMLQHAAPSEASPGGSQTHSHSHPHLNHHQQRLLPFSDLLSDEELRKTAGQILNGIHREVEVQSVNSIISTYQDVLLDNEDYLNPIHKDVVVTESGLRQHQHHHHQQQHSGGSSNSNGGGGVGGNSSSSSSILASSLTHSQYYITEIDPMELGIQMSHHQVEPSEEEVLFSDDFNLNYFGYNPGSDIVA
ncbi:GH17913, partial [Drosophila grimshawi]